VWGGLVVTGFGLENIGKQIVNAVDKYNLDTTGAAGVRIRVDPDHVDAVAGEFESLARDVAERRAAAEHLGTITPPGADPVSTQAVARYGEVAHGGPGEYLENLVKLENSLRSTAANLRSTAGRVRYTEQTNTGMATGA
jgi:hypothetical protein